MLREIPGVDVDCVSSYQEAADVLQSRPSNLLLFRFSDGVSPGDRVLKIIRPGKKNIITIGIVANPRPERIRELVTKYKVVDILTDSADRDRVRSAIQKAVEQVRPNSDRSSRYRGFFGFVGIVPSLRERKVLAECGLGFIQNQSLRLAIDYWRGNPNTQMVAVAFQKKETFTSRLEELSDTWEEAGVLPWHIGMFEAQEHYLEYWQEPIRDGLMPAVLPVMLKQKNGIETLTLVDPELQRQILVKVGHETRLGNIEERLRFLKIQLRADHSDFRTRYFEEFIPALEKQMELVDSAYPHLTRPPTETGWEDFTPDVATPYREEYSEMAYLHNRWTA